MSRIYWDTMLFVYWIEDHPRYANRIRQLLLKMETRRDQLAPASLPSPRPSLDHVSRAMGKSQAECLPLFVHHSWK
jgi:hypothetical protein